MTKATFTEAGAFVDEGGDQHTHGQFLAPAEVADAARAAGWLVADMGELVSVTKLAADDVPDGMARAPFDEEQRAALVLWQHCGWVHQLMCSGHPTTFDHGPVVMDVATSGLHCRICKYVQRDVPVVCYGDLPPNPADQFEPSGELVLTPDMETGDPLNAGEQFERLARAGGMTVTRIDPDAEQRLIDSGLRFLKVTSPPHAKRPEALLVDGVVYWPEGTVH